MKWPRNVASSNSESAKGRIGMVYGTEDEGSKVDERVADIGIVKIMKIV
jgi:hypothetical protein